MLLAIETLDKWPCLIKLHAEENVHSKQILAIHTGEKKKMPLKYIHMVFDDYLHICHMGTT